MDAVGDILAQRQEERAPWGSASALAFLLHAGVLAAFLASAFAHPVRYAAPRAVAVRLLPAGAVRAPAVVQQPEPAPPPAAPKPKIEKPPPVEEAPKPSKNALLLPAKEDKKKKPTPAPVSRPGPAAPAVSLPSAGDDTSGSADAGAAGPGASAGIGSLKLDQSDFKYPVYIEQMVGIISRNRRDFTKSVVVHFQIERDGTITDIKIVTSSGLPFVDRAAQRALYDSSPLPPLPAEFGGPRLGVQVVFE
ncbi:MAG TPA: TonB family protein [Thermoanaerobaculia bacterium]|nr:TonB family protein [Thermoanaerobaculia bacterium]